MGTLTTPTLARLALATLLSLSRGELLAVIPERLRETWLARAVRDAGPEDVTVLGCFAMRNRAGLEWPACILRVRRTPLGLGHPERVVLVAAYLDEQLQVQAQMVKEPPTRFLGSPGGKAGILNGDGAGPTEPSPARALSAASRGTAGSPRRSSAGGRRREPC